MKSIRVFCLILAFMLVADGCEKKETSIHEAAEAGDIHSLRLLISEGADVNARTSSGLTPLHYSAKDGDFYVVEMLVTRGADINVKDNDGKTPLALAKSEGHKKTIELLRKHGAEEL